MEGQGFGFVPRLVKPSACRFASGHNGFCNNGQSAAGETRIANATERVNVSALIFYDKRILLFWGMKIFRNGLFFL